MLVRNSGPQYWEKWAWNYSLPNLSSQLSLPHFLTISEPRTVSPAWDGAPSKGTPASSSCQSSKGITRLCLFWKMSFSFLSVLTRISPSCWHWNQLLSPPLSAAYDLIRGKIFPFAHLCHPLVGSACGAVSLPPTPNPAERFCYLSMSPTLRKEPGTRLCESLEATPWVLLENLFLGERQHHFMGMAGLQMELGNKWLPWANSTDKWWANFSSVRAFCICWSESAKKFKFICLEPYLPLCLSGSI